MSTDNSSIDQLLDLLIDALEARRTVRSAEPNLTSHDTNITPAEPITVEAETPVDAIPLSAETTTVEPDSIEPQEDTHIQEWLDPLDEEQSEDAIDAADADLDAEPIINLLELEDERLVDSAESNPPTQPVYQESVNLNRMLSRLAIVLAFILVLINIPLGLDGLGSTLATAMPDSESSITFTSWNGMLLQASGKKVYLLEDEHLRWITTKAIFQERGYRWGDINKVSQEQLDEFPLGTPILRATHNASEPVVAKCAGSPHIYVVDGVTKRWVRDIQTFSAEGYIWSDVIFMSCTTLRNIPDGETIPVGSGEPPSP